MRAHVVYRSLHTGLIIKTKQESTRNNTKQNRYRQSEAIVGVCSAGMKCCCCAEACSASFSLGARVALGARFPCLRGQGCVCARMLIVRSQVPLRQPEDGQYRPKHVVVHYIVIKYTSCDTVVFDYISFSKFHTHNGDDALPRLIFLVFQIYQFCHKLQGYIIYV